MPARSLRTNLIGAGADLVLPPSGDPWELDKQAGSEQFTFIFSPTLLMSPAFFAGNVPYELKQEEIAVLDEFRAKFKSDAPDLSAAGEGPDRRVTVNVPTTPGGRTLIFDIRIDHK
jgi:hypothetical protein